MKKIFIIAITFIFTGILPAQVQFDALKITPQFPAINQMIHFEFNAHQSSLIDAKKIDVVVYLFSKDGFAAIEPAITQKGKAYSGNFKITGNTQAFAFSFIAGEQKDLNGGKGYFIPVYNTHRKPVKGYYQNASRVVDGGYGEYLLGITADPAKGLACLEEGIQQYPELKADPEYFNDYINTISKAKKEAATALIESELAQFESKENLTDAGYGILIRWYTNIKKTTTADSLTTVMQKLFPIGNWKKEALENAINRGNGNAAEKIALYESYVKIYPPHTEIDRRTITYFWSNIAIAYHKEKNDSAFKYWAKKLPMPFKASLYSHLAEEMAGTKENLVQAKLLSKEATEWAKKEMTAPVEKQPVIATKKKWMEDRKNDYAGYAYTYANILYAMGDYKTGLPYAKDAAGLADFKYAGYNERYAQFAENVMPAADAIKIIAQFIKDGTGSPKTKDILKALYVKTKKTDAGYSDYITALQQAASLKKKAELKKAMLNVAAPAFALKDLEGNLISLESLKGKVVVVDFWATWCGPCIASMPAMKMVQESFRERADVAFVFVDTWEHGENTAQEATDFMKKNNYPFHVLLDKESKVVNDFNIRGIPTKFIIDKTGNIRFKSMGYSGNDDGMIDEVKLMVEMASADIPR